MRAIAAFAFVAAIWGTLFWIAYRLVRGSLKFAGIAWRVVMVVFLASLLSVPGWWPGDVLVATALAAGADTGARRSLMVRVASLSVVTRLVAFARPRRTRVIVIPLAILLAVDSLLEGYWSPAETLVGAVELAVLGAVADRSLSRQPLRLRPLLKQSLILALVIAGLAAIITSPIEPWRSARDSLGVLLAIPPIMVGLGLPRLFEVRREEAKAAAAG
jgi:hypothetical protein